MAASSIYVVLLVLTSIDNVHCEGHFFRINKDNIHMTMEEPFLTADVFDCQREKSCTTLIRKSKSNIEGIDSKNAIFSISKTTDPSAKYPSCATAMQVNDNKEGYYNIHHGNMLHSVEVECKVINGTTYAIIHHDSEKTELVDGYESAGSFRRHFEYAINFEEAKAFVDESELCSQFTRFDCHHSAIFYKGIHLSYFIDRNNISMAYTGGGPVNGKGCKCGITNECVENGTLCNCDKNDRVWRYDSGFVTEKVHLPLTEVRIGDTGSSHEMMRYTVGPVKCQSMV